MPAAAAAAIKAAAKKIFTDFLNDPSKTVRNILIAIFIPILIMVLLVVFPAFVTVSIPTILLGDTNNSTVEEKYISMYQQVPITINNEINDWISNEKKNYSSYGDIKVSMNYTLTWRELMAIDTVRYGQDFSGVTNKSIKALGEMFVEESEKTETYTDTETTKVWVHNYVQVWVPKYVQVWVSNYVEVWVWLVPYDHSYGGYYELVDQGHWETQDQGHWETQDQGHWETQTTTVTKNRAVLTINTKSLKDVCKMLGFSDSDIDYVNNIYDSLSALDIEGDLNIYDDNLPNYPPGNAKIPYFNQGDARWANHPYGSSTIKDGGCGPTSLAMVVAGLTGRSDINPIVIADWSVQHGCRAEGAGSYWSLMTEGGAAFGLKVQAISRKDPKTIVNALSAGNPVIAAMGRGHFTRGGHFIVLRGVDKNGKILVNDPASVQRTNVAWDLSIIMNESSKNGGDSGSPFWIFTK